MDFVTYISLNLPCYYPYLFDMIMWQNKLASKQDQITLSTRYKSKSYQKW